MIVVVDQSLGRVLILSTPWTVAHQAPLSIGFSRQEYWSGVLFPSPGDLPDPGIEPGSPALAGGFFYQLCCQSLVLVPSGCYNRILQSEWLINHRQLFLTVVEAVSSRSRRQWILCLVRARLLPGSQDSPPPSWFTKGLKNVWLIIWENVTQIISAM